MLSAKPFMKKYVIIVAGGKGLRMGSELPKQFLPIGGKPVLCVRWKHSRSMRLHFDYISASQRTTGFLETAL